MMRLAVIAPQHEKSTYEQAAARSPRFEIVHFVHDLATTDGIDELLAQADQFDGVCMISPCSASQEQIAAFAAAKKHLLCNAQNTTGENLKRWQATWRSTKAHFAVVQPGRFTPYATAIRDAVDTQKLGTSGLVRIHCWLQRNTAGGSLGELENKNQARAASVAEIDLACWLFDTMPELVFARRFAGDQPGSPAGTLIHLGFEAGMAIIDIGLHDAPNYYSASLIGSQGAAYADDHHNTNLLLKQKTIGLRVPQSNTQLSWLRPQLEAFVDAVETNQPDNSVQQMLEAVDISSCVEFSADGQVAKRIGDKYELQ